MLNRSCASHHERTAPWTHHALMPWLNHSSRSALAAAPFVVFCLAPAGFSACLPPRMRLPGTARRSRTRSGAGSAGPIRSHRLVRPNPSVAKAVASQIPVLHLRLTMRRLSRWDSPVARPRSCARGHRSRINVAIRMKRVSQVLPTIAIRKRSAAGHAQVGWVAAASNSIKNASVASACRLTPPASRAPVARDSARSGRSGHRQRLGPPHAARAAFLAREARKEVARHHLRACGDERGEAIWPHSGLDEGDVPRVPRLMHGQAR